jgi:hypothetical protein
MRRAILGLALCGFACSGSDAVDDDDKPSGDDNADDGNDETGDTSVGGNTYWEPAAVGFEFDGTVLSNGETGSFLYDDEVAGTYERFPLMIVTFASLEYFEAGLTEEERTEQSCVAFGLFYGIPLEKPTQIPTTDDAPLFWSYDMALDLLTDAGDHDCTGKIDPAIWGTDSENLLGPFDGAHFGYGWGAQTDYLREPWEDATFADDEFLNSMLASYIAINDINGDWVGDDWTTGFTFEWDEVTGYRVLVEDPEDPENQLLVYDDMSDLVVGGPLPPVYMRSSSGWLQDFPLMDLSNLHDGAP